MRAAKAEGPKTGIPTCAVSEPYARRAIHCTFAEVRLDAIYERLFRTREDERDLTDRRKLYRGFLDGSWCRTSFRSAKSTSAGKSEGERSTFTVLGSRDVPPFPGQTKILRTSGDWDSFQASACSRPPLPMRRTLSAVMR